jgi:hypothetical protein
MFAKQWKLGLAVVKLLFLPGGLSMALGAVCAQGSLVGIILLVTGDAVLTKWVSQVTSVTGITLYRVMLAI